MIGKSLNEEKEWYIDAIRSKLILAYSLSASSANAAMANYRLEERLERFWKS